MVVGLLSLSAYAASRDPYLDDYNGPVDKVDINDLLTNQEPLVKPSCHIRIEVYVLHNDKPKEEFTCYPYPVRPPDQKTKQIDLPTSRKAIKGFLLNSGYAMRSADKYAYPMFGWRWQYAYHAALDKFQGTVPHTIVSIYPFIDDLSPYILAEDKRINAQEKVRKARWQKAVDEYNDNHQDLEAEAAEKGLAPIPVTMKKRYLGSADVPPGTWWISGVHKVAGLQYYWVEPITVAAGDNITLHFTEDNALIVIGGW